MYQTPSGNPSGPWSFEPAHSFPGGGVGVTRRHGKTPSHNSGPTGRLHHCLEVIYSVIAERGYTRGQPTSQRSRLQRQLTLASARI
ncbi:hypothetical protein ES703_26929 [subsurface metagenome]